MNVSPAAAENRLLLAGKLKLVELLQNLARKELKNHGIQAKTAIPQVACCVYAEIAQDDYKPSFKNTLSASTLKNVSFTFRS